MDDINVVEKVLVIFGSDSDHDVYDAICGYFANNGIEYEMVVASAHRTPEKVHEIVGKGDHSVIIAGAGLAAALPGVVASLTTSPVIGVPVSANFQGLDALLSIMQMPPGIPVMTVGVDKAEIAAKNAAKMLKNFEYINIIGDSENPRVKKAIDMIQKFDCEYKVSTGVYEEAVNIKFIEFGDKVEEQNALMIYVPLSSEDLSAENATNLIKMSEDGLWVGLNRGENAAIAALEVMNMDGRFMEQMGLYRQSLKKPKEK